MFGSHHNVASVRVSEIEISDGELFVLAGSGGSRVLREIAGLEAATADVFIGDRPVNEVAPAARDVAMVFTDGALYPRMSVRENLAFGLKLRKYGATEIDRRISEAAAIARVADILERKAKQLSPTQRCRAAIARAIVRQPKVILCDDPFAVLGNAEQVQMRLELKRLHQRIGTTTIFATSDPNEALTLADRAALIDGGRAVQIGTPEEIYERPESLSVAPFFGSPPINLVRGNVKQEKTGFTFVEEGDGTIKLPLGSLGESLAGRQVVLGVRPEHITPTDERTGFAALVEMIEPRGADTTLHLQTGAHTLICRIWGKLDNTSSGNRIRCAIDPSRVHLFDVETGRRC